ncbi:MAG: methyltransferase domain-containing protein [Vicinamibacterales bacterium]
MARDLSHVVTTYSSAADHFDALPFWHHFGRATVRLAGLAPGARVVDLFCGTGGSAIPAAEAAGPTGSVLGVDATPALIEIARARAAAAGLAHARFEVADVVTLDLPAASLDAAISVFGLFFLDDMAGMLRRAWSWLAPGGALVTTAWSEVVLSPGEDYFWEEVHREQPALDHISTSSRLSPPGALEALYAEAGLPAPVVTEESWRMPLASPVAFWPVILGTSNRGVLEALPADAQDRVKRAVLSRLAAERVDGLDMVARVAVARKGRGR